MKKLTPERQQIAELAIAEGAFAKSAAEKLNRYDVQGGGWKAWTVAIRPYWDAQETLIKTLGVSMTRAIALIEGMMFLSDYYEPTGEPRKAVK